MERMSETVTDCNYQSLHHFISNSDWDDKAVFDAVAKDVDAKLGGYEDSALLLDETCCAKKGVKSVGVQRQWLGRYGKVDKGQVFVCAALSRRDKVGLIDNRLFLGEEWVNDRERCLAAGVPEKEIVHRTKQELALELVEQARANGVRFSWVGADGLYGNDPAFLRKLEDMGETFTIDCHSDQAIWLDDPCPYLPEKKSARGRAPSRLTSDAESIQVREWVRAQKESAWQRKSIRKAYSGELRAEFLFRRIWVWDNKEKAARNWWLIVRRECNSKQEIKYTLSNAPADTPLHHLVRMQAQRYWIERAFQDAKSHAGFAQYQVRGWRGLHHHLAMVFLVLLFMLEERLSMRGILQKISCGGIVMLLRSQLPSRLHDPDNVLKCILDKLSIYDNEDSGLSRICA